MVQPDVENRMMFDTFKLSNPDPRIITYRIQFSLLSEGLKSKVLVFALAVKLNKINTNYLIEYLAE